MNAHVNQLSATEKHKRAVESLASGKTLLTPEQTRHLWLSVAGLALSARDAEHAAYLIMMETERKDLTLVVEAEEFLRNHLNKVREQMAFVRKLLAAVEVVQ